MPAIRIPRQTTILLGLLLCALVMALFQLGARGLWDPDEGRYSNVALLMVDTGDYLVPRRHHESLHVTKPPVTYWTIAASVEAFGRSEWALRLPMALAYVLTVMMMFGLGRVFVPARPWLPAVLYLASPVPLVAAGVITTDSLLAFAETAAMLAYVQHRFAGGTARWLDVMWVLFGLAFMIKGPPSLLPMLAIVAWEWRLRSLAVLRRPLGIAAFCVVGFSWFVWIIVRYPELLGYFVGHEVVDRIASAGHDRNGEWYGAFLIYLPTLALGSLPWAALVLWRRVTRRDPAVMSENSRFLWIWFGLPLVVFFISQSRLPFYVLPLFVPLCLLAAQSLSNLAITRLHVGLMAGWLVLLLAIKAVVAQVPDIQDTRRFAEQLRPLLPEAPSEIVFVEARARYGLHFYLDAPIEKVSFAPLPGKKPPSDAPYDHDLPSELAEPEQPRYFLVPKSKEQRFVDIVANNGKRARRLGDVNKLAVYSVEAMAAGR